jgi:hypothetical protein
MDFHPMTPTGRVMVTHWKVWNPAGWKGMATHLKVRKAGLNAEICTFEMLIIANI